jgi:O-antigen ligase
MITAAVLAPLLAWLGPLGFAPLMALVGLACLPAARIGWREAPLVGLLGLTLAWALLSLLWSPSEGGETALKLAAQLVLYLAAWRAAARVPDAYRDRALRLFAWGFALYGALLMVEAMTGGVVYRTLRDLIGDPIRDDLARKNIAQGSFALALLWPLAAAGGVRAGAPVWLALPMAAGTALLAQVFLSDAPVLAVGLVIGVGALVWIWPRSAPRIFALGAAALVLLTPLIVMVAQAVLASRTLPVSWGQRVGYWMHAMERLSEHPWRGWGLEASRAFSPAIQLHPHNGALQAWLELGMIGAGVLALTWAFVFRRLAGDARDLVTCAAAGSAAVYLFFGMGSFGLWQEWWLALGALAAMMAALAKR